MGKSFVNELREVRAPEAVAVPRDVRARRPGVLRWIIHADTLRRVVRVATLGALDIAAVFMATWTALELKATIRRRTSRRLRA
jgi:hypothetical protein